MAFLLFLVAWALVALLILGVITICAMPKPPRGRAIPHGTQEVQRLRQEELTQAHRLSQALDGGAQ